MSSDFFLHSGNRIVPNDRHQQYNTNFYSAQRVRGRVFFPCENGRLYDIAIPHSIVDRIEELHHNAEKTLSRVPFVLNTRDRASINSLSPLP